MRGGFRERMMIWGGGALLLALGLVARAAEVRAMRIDPTPDFTRVTFELSGPLDYKLFAIANPDRIVLDLHAARFAAGFAAPAGDGLLKGVRTGQRDPGDLRVVFDLDHGVRPQSFLLPPNEDGGYRLVVDLYKKEKSRIAAVKNARALEAKPRDVVVAIDAGHGGVDPGAIGAGGAREKNITLAVARDLKRLIDRQPGMSAVLTRDGDYFLPLKERYQKARAAKADLFISIHADAYTSGDASGSSVWMLSPRGASSEAARWLAERENRADLVGGVSLENKDDTLAAVLLDLSQSATLEASGAVAEQVLRAFARRAVDPGRDRVHHQPGRGAAPDQRAAAGEARRGDPRRRARVLPGGAAAGKLVRGECAQGQAARGGDARGRRRFGGRHARSTRRGARAELVTRVHRAANPRQRNRSGTGCTWPQAWHVRAATER